MRLFLDTADREALARWLEIGLFHGVTTNPTILKRAGVPCTADALSSLAQDVFALGAREMQAQAWGGAFEAYRETGRAIASIDERMVVKLPATEPGMRAARALIGEGARVTLTAVYATHQAVSARALGASYVAPYYGRIGDGGHDAAAMVTDMVRVCEGGPRVLVASIRCASDVALLAAMGADTFTFGPAVARELVEEPATLAATEAFEADSRA